MFKRRAKTSSESAARPAYPARRVVPIASPAVAISGRRRPRFWRKAFWSKKRLIIAVSASTLIIASGLGAYFFFTAGHGKFSLKNLVTSAVKAELKATPVKGQDRGRTNFLIYGMTIDGQRTDSIILASYYWKEKKLATVNIPRDLYVYDGYENVKIGEAYAYAKSRQPKDAAYPDTFVASVISKEYNQPIDYWAQFNMQGEVDFINAIGGVDINVPVAFTDYAYPKWDYSGYIWPAPRFSVGTQHMNGATALIYSRSRHSLDNDQGTDFARSNRQAQVIQAVGAKLKSMGVIGNITQISKYLNILGNNLTTNMSTDEMVSFAKTVSGISPSADFIHGNWATGNGFLCDSSTAASAYITLYGASASCTLGTSGVGGGGYKDSNSRQLAVYYIQNLLTSAPLAPADFIKAGTQALWPSPSPSAGSSNP
jgi:LCP family protein required for cell wall assembly